MVFEADIKGCFDHIDHNFALEVCPLYRKIDLEVMKKWLKMGAMINGDYIESEMGTPQGSIIGPIVKNVISSSIVI
jgi:RNA-directed DNA polymerase